MATGANLPQSRRKRIAAVSTAEHPLPRAPQWQRPGGVPETSEYAPNSVAVYRLFNQPGALLYVGISSRPKHRFAQHAASQPWWYRVSSWTVEWFPDRAAAEAEESRAIVDEVPAYNLAGVPAAEDERRPKEEWIATFQRRQPGRADLEALFLAIVRLRSLGNDPAARRAWTDAEALAVYEYAKKHAKRIDVHDNQQFIDRWNAEQEDADRRQRGEPDPPFLPRWPQSANLRERVALWILGRSSRVRVWAPLRSPAVIENRARAAARKVRCTATGFLASVCDCHSHHIADEKEEQKYGRPIGHPYGARNRRRDASAA
jgi:hypothetical protein